MACAQEVLGASRLVKAFGREEHEQRRFLGHAMNWVRQHNTLASIGSGFDFMFGMSVTIGTAIALFIGVTHVKAGRLSLGDLLLLMAYMAQLAGPLDTIAKKLTELQSHLLGFRRALARNAASCHGPARLMPTGRNRKATSRSGESPLPILHHRQCCATSRFTFRQARASA